jgi:tetratricopeptide (TPR) repeat protein
MYMIHNMHFIAYARWMQGRRADGIQAADELAAAIHPMAASMPELADAFLTMPVFARARFGDWEGILKLPQPDREKQPTTGLILHYARALAHQARGNGRAALVEQSAFEAGRKQVAPDAPWGTNNKAADRLAVASEILAARLGNASEAVAHFRRAVELQDALTYDEPPAWYYPVRESLGGALLRAGQAAEAEQVFREGVHRSPRNGRMLFGLFESLRAQGKSDAASSVQREHSAAWSKADVKLRVGDL